MRTGTGSFSPSMAISALIKALPRSKNTATPFSERTDSMAAVIF